MEQHLLELINRQWTSPRLDLFMAAMSSFEIWTPILILLAAVMWAAGGFRARAALICCALVVGITDGLVCNALKKIVARPRPRELLASVRIVDLEKARPRLLALFRPAKIEMSRPRSGEIHGHSFPSSHAANNFAAAVVLAFFFRRGWLYFFPAAIVSYSRIYVGAHWPGDVLASMFLGIGLALLLLPALAFLWKKIGASMLPGFFARHPSLFETAAR